MSFPTKFEVKGRPYDKTHIDDSMDSWSQWPLCTDIITALDQYDRWYDLKTKTCQNIRPYHTCLVNKTLSTLKLNKFDEVLIFRLPIMCRVLSISTRLNFFYKKVYQVYVWCEKIFVDLHIANKLQTLLALSKHQHSNTDKRYNFLTSPDFVPPRM